MTESKTVELGPNGQQTVKYDVSENTHTILVTAMSPQHSDVSLIPSWDIDDKEFPEEPRNIDEFPGKLEPLGDKLLLKIRNETDKETEVTVGIREKKVLAKA